MVNIKFNNKQKLTFLIGFVVNRVAVG